MSNVRSRAMLVASLFALAEFAIGWQTGLPLWLAFPLAIAAGGIVLWAALALDALTRRASRPDRRDIIDVRDLQHANVAMIELQDQHLARLEARFDRLVIERDLAGAERDLQRAAEQVEHWDMLARDLPRWNAAMEQWSALVARIDPGLAPDTGPASDAELQAARAQLPPARNFSSQDLKAAVAYFVQRQRIVAAHERLQAHATQR